MAPKPLGKLLDRYRITDGRGFRLRDHDPADTGGKLVQKEQATELLAQGVARLAELHEHLYASRRWALLSLFQAMDAAGKDSAIKHVMSGVNPQGVTVTAFKQPSTEELDHGFLWRINRAMPPRGHIGIFNRSHYEDVVAPRADPSILPRLGIPASLLGPNLWTERLAAIATFEAYLAQQGTVLAKVFLNISRGEQRKRLLARLEDRSKEWKFDPSDLSARDRWAEHRAAYEAAFNATATNAAPWYVVPADSKPIARAVVQSILLTTLEGLDLSRSVPSAERQAAMAAARQHLTA